MTNKRQVIVDEINVSKCVFMSVVNGRTLCDCATTNIIGKSLCPYTDCLSNLNCYYKQLKRKEQECDHYRKVIEEIKEECDYAPMCDTEFSERVLDIINIIKED